MTNICVSGSEFKASHCDKVLVKLTNERNVHHSVEYIEGLITDPVSFVPDANCGGGLFFCELRDAYKWISYTKSGQMYWAWDVFIPDDAKIVVMSGKIKCNKFVLSNKRHIWSTSAIYSEIVNRDRSCLSRVIINDINELLTAYELDKLRIVDMPNLIGKISIDKFVMHCEKFPWLISYVDIHEITLEIFKKCYKSNPQLTLETMPKLTKDMCEYAIQCCPNNIKCIPDNLITQDMCNRAVENGASVLYVPEQFRNEQLYIIAAKKNGHAVMHLSQNERTENICIAAVSSNVSSIINFKSSERTPVVLKAAIKAFSEQQVMDHECDSIMDIIFT